MESDEDKLALITAIFEKQFENKDPEGLTGMPRFAYLSQKHSIEAQVIGYLSKKEGLTKGGSKAPKQGGSKAPKAQEEGEGQVQGEEESFIHVNELYDQLINSMWINNTGQMLKLSPAQSKERLRYFTDRCIAQDDAIKSESDYKRHFVNWMEKPTKDTVSNRPVAKMTKEEQAQAIKERMKNRDNRTYEDLINEENEQH